MSRATTGPGGAPLLGSSAPAAEGPKIITVTADPTGTLVPDEQGDVAVRQAASDLSTQAALYYNQDGTKDGWLRVLQYLEGAYDVGNVLPGTLTKRNGEYLLMCEDREGHTQWANLYVLKEFSDNRQYAEKLLYLQTDPANTLSVENMDVGGPFVGMIRRLQSGVPRKYKLTVVTAPEFLDDGTTLVMPYRRLSDGAMGSVTVVMRHGEGPGGEVRVNLDEIENTQAALANSLYFAVVFNSENSLNGPLGTTAGPDFFVQSRRFGRELQGEAFDPSGTAIEDGDITFDPNYYDVDYDLRKATDAIISIDAVLAELRRMATAVNMHDLVGDSADPSDTGLPELVIGSDIYPGPVGQIVGTFGGSKGWLRRVGTGDDPDGKQFRPLHRLSCRPASTTDANQVFDSPALRLDQTGKCSIRITGQIEKPTTFTGTDAVVLALRLNGAAHFLFGASVRTTISSPYGVPAKEIHVTGESTGPSRFLCDPAAPIASGITGRFNFALTLNFHRPELPAEGFWPYREVDWTIYYDGGTGGSAYPVTIAKGTGWFGESEYGPLGSISTVGIEGGTLDDGDGHFVPSPLIWGPTTIMEIEWL